MGAAVPSLRPARSARAAEIVAAARRVVERNGPGGLTMRAVADELQIKAPSLYKHVSGKPGIKADLVAAALLEMGEALHAALETAPAAGGGGRVTAVLTAYRRQALAQPDMYRLATAGPLARQQLPPGLEDWAGSPFFLVTDDPYRAQALWSFAHGMVILELDGRFPEGSDLDQTWAAGAAAFERSCA